MKKLLLVLLLSCTVVTFAQTDEKFPQDVNKKHEIKYIKSKLEIIDEEKLINTIT